MAKFKTYYQYEALSTSFNIRKYSTTNWRFEEWFKITLKDNTIRWKLTRTLLLLFGTRAYLSSPNEGSCYIFSTRNNCCEFLVSHGVILQTDIQPHGLCSKNVTKKRFLILFCQNPDDIGILLNFLRWQLLGNISCFLNEASELLWQKQNNFELALTFFAFVWIDFFD